ncbi:chromatin remodelling complex Rsc7/Swp82 subunit-domain-containing protein [Sporodiniella umbellata]|nr:chromatin remodelling complex Rsc7/Swp82 subunit-domain-containing protein [Sporodiniella umbellata]
MDPSKILGYRDSYLFFLKNPTLKRVRVNEEEKSLLVKKGLLIAWFKGREVAVVKARSVFKLFGSRIVKGGRRGIDDYFEGRKVAETDNNPSSTEEIHEDTGRHGEYYFNEAALDNRNWMHHAALATRGFNARLGERRAGKPTFYDVHSDVNQVPYAYQPQTCQFELINNAREDQEPQIEYRSLSHSRFRGVGKDILDSPNLDQILASLPEHERPHAKEALEEKSIIQPIEPDQDHRYPISLMDGQYQHAFPVHQTRFSYPTPKIPEPNVIFDTAQSLSAQQYYLGVVYQTVNQFADPRRQQQQSSSQHRPGMFIPPVQPMLPATPSIQPSHVCAYKVSLSQTCDRSVNQAGQLCPAHQNASKAMNEHAKAPPPITPSYVDSCADCHQARASDTLYTGLKQTRMTDDGVLIKCSRCTRKYHPICANLTTPKQTVAIESYAWLCPECKICEGCKTAGDEATLMICDGCDRGWHTGCFTPPIERIPQGEWLCQLCAKCHGCSERGMKEESQYTHVSMPAQDTKYPVYLATYCGPCTVDFEEGRLCPVCLKTYSEEENDEEDNEMVACDTCDHWVHTRCDALLTNERYQLLCDDESAKYSCPMCENRVTPIHQTEKANLILKGALPPGGVSVGLLGGKVKTRGVVQYKKIRIGVPQIDGSDLLVTLT